MCIKKKKIVHTKYKTEKSRIKILKKERKIALNKKENKISKEIKINKNQQEEITQIKQVLL